MDKKEFETIVKDNQKMIYNLCYRFSGNHADAGELMQKTFLKAYEKIDTFKGASNIKTWLYTIAANLSKNHLRYNKGKALAPLNERLASAQNPAQETIDLEKRRALAGALYSLPLKQRQVIALRIYEELPFSQIAAILRQSENSAKVNFHTGMKKLKQIFGSKKED